MSLAQRIATKLGQTVILREEITLQHKDLLKMFYKDPERYNFALQLIIINEWNMMYQQLHQLQLEEKIPDNTYIIEDRTVYSTQFFITENIKDEFEIAKLQQMLEHSTFNLLPNKLNYTIFCEPGIEQMIKWFKQREIEGNKGTDKDIPKDYLIQIYNRYLKMIKQVHPQYIRIDNKIPNLEHMFRTLFIHEMHETEGYNQEKIYQLQEYWDEYLEPKLAKIPTKSYTVLIPFTKKDQKWQILTAQRLDVTIYPNQYETMGGSIEETDKGIFTAAIRECEEETGYTPEEIRMQLILNHQYLSINKNGTQTFVKGIHDIAQVEKRIQIFTFIYYVYPKEYEKFTNKEPEKASPRKWMTLEEVQHELFTPTIHYYKEEIFDKHIPAYWEEFTLKRRVCTKGTHCKIEMIDRYF